MSLDAALDRFVEHYVKSFTELTTEYDPDWPSPCEQGRFFRDARGQDRIHWRPVRREPGTDDFVRLEAALELPLHPDIKTYYGRYWAANMEAEAPDGHVSLLFLWNERDVDRLIENLIGHAVACRHNRTPFAVFFACTEPDSDYYLTVNNETGQVQVEQPGHKPLRTVADDLAGFLDLLVPAAPA